MRKTLPIILVLLLVFLSGFLFSCSVQIRDRESVKSSERMRGVYHRVKSGETLWRISKAYNVDLQELAEINNITDASRISVGSVVFIPDVPQVIDLPPVKPPAETRPAVVKQPEKPMTAGAPPERAQLGSEAAARAAVAGSTVGGRSKVKEESITDRTATAKTERSPAAAVKPPEKSTPRPIEKVDPSASADGKTQVAAIPAPPPPPAKTPETALKDRTAAVPPPKKPGPEASAEEGQIRVEKGRFQWPVKGPVITRFGIQPGSGMKYNGIKIAAKEGAPVYAAAAGTIIYASYVKGYGDTIIVKHDENFTSVYAYLKSSAAKRDDRVKKGEKIASVGPAEESGGEPYLYFEIREKNKARNPLFFLP
ncbi:MAG TPA: peptidoglycan DD-metalloendopeptidase family protein [Syntrophales bacterium]